MSPFRLLILLSMLVPANAAWAYVPPAQRIVGLWQGAYEKSAPVTLTGSWQQGAVTTPFVISVQKNALSILENGRPSTDVTSQMVWDFLLRPVAALEILQSRGLVLEETGLARSGGAITWTLGATGENRRGTQIWIDREWLTPHRVILKNPAGAPDTVDFSDFSPDNHLYPLKIKCRVGGIERVYRVNEISR